MAFSFSSARTTIGPLDMKSVSELKNGRAGMHGVELLRLVLGDLQHLHGKDVEAILFELLDDVADRILAHGVRFNDGESALQSFHNSSLVLVVF